MRKLRLKREIDLARVMGQVSGRDRTRTQVSRLSWLRAFSVALQLGETRCWVPTWFIKQSGQVHFSILDSTIFHADYCASLKGKKTRSELLLWFSSPLTEPLALRENQSRALKTLVQILVLLVTHCVTLGKLLPLSSTYAPNQEYSVYFMSD